LHYSPMTLSPRWDAIAFEVLTSGDDLSTKVEAGVVADIKMLIFGFELVDNRALKVAREVVPGTDEVDHDECSRTTNDECNMSRRVHDKPLEQVTPEPFVAARIHGTKVGQLDRVWRSQRPI
jgi:hypothetical protein